MTNDFVTAETLREMQRNEPTGETMRVNQAGRLGLVAGTQISTFEGPVAVEYICTGDVLVTGGPEPGRMRGVVLNNPRQISIARQPAADYLRPVRIMAGALGNNLPERDLRVAPRQRLYVDGSLVQAKTLINGETIIQEGFSGQIVYHHIELERPDIIVAEGVPVESFWKGALIRSTML